MGVLLLMPTQMKLPINIRKYRNRKMQIEINNRIEEIHAQADLMIMILRDHAVIHYLISSIILRLISINLPLIEISIRNYSSILSSRRRFKTRR